MLFEQRGSRANEQIEGESEDGRKEDNQEQGKRLYDNARRAGSDILDDPHGHGEPDNEQAADHYLDNHFEGERRREIGQELLEFLEIENG
jgi:hypothetical protein